MKFLRLDCFRWFENKNTFRSMANKIRGSKARGGGAELNFKVYQKQVGSH